MLAFQQNIPRHTKRKEKFEETEQASEPDSHTAQMLELSRQKFKTTMKNRLSTVTEKVDNMWEHMGNVSKNMEILGENKEEM